MGASLVLSCCQHVNHWDELQPHAELCRILSGALSLAACLISPCIPISHQNKSLFSSVQISKLSMIPVVCVMEWILHSKHYTREVKMAVVVVVVGVGVCTVTDVKVNAKGFICACVAVLSTSLQQIVSMIQCFPTF